MSFVSSLQQAWHRSRSMLCVGLDPDPARLPPALSGAEGESEAILHFCRGIVDATAPFACAFKPQIAYFAAARAEAQLEVLVDYIHRAHPGIPVVLDAKRGDIGATAEQYAAEAFDRYRADAVTVNPYMGFDSIEPYLRDRQRGVFLLCRTSNPGGSDLQGLNLADGTPLFEHVARLAAGPWNRNGQLGLVVGATFPEELARVRQLVGEMPLLVPGIGAQGGDVDTTTRAGLARGGFGMLVNSSRAILYASAGEDWADAASRVARETRDALSQAQARYA